MLLFDCVFAFCANAPYICSWPVPSYEVGLIAPEMRLEFSILMLDAAFFVVCGCPKFCWPPAVIRSGVAYLPISCGYMLVEMYPALLLS